VPVLTVFAGPNGSGKSSLIRQVEFEGRETCWNPTLLPGASSRIFRERLASQPGEKFSVGRRRMFDARRA